MHCLLTYRQFWQALSAFNSSLHWLPDYLSDENVQGMKIQEGVLSLKILGRDGLSIMRKMMITDNSLNIWKGQYHSPCHKIIS